MSRAETVRAHTLAHANTSMYTVYPHTDPATGKRSFRSDRDIEEYAGDVFVRYWCVRVWYAVGVWI